MKKNILVMAFGMAAMLMLTPNESFATSKNIARAENLMPGDDDDDRGSKVDLTDSEKYALKKPAKRSSGKGQSFKETSARMQARLAARGNFAEALRAAVVSAAKNVYGENQQIITDEYAKDDEGAEDMATHTEAGEKQSTLLKSITNEVIQNTVEVKMDKYYNKKKRRYTIYVCMEYDGEVKDMVENTVKKIRSRIPEKDRKRIDEHLEKFEFEIEQELNKQGDSSDE